MKEKLLEVKDLVTSFRTDAGSFNAVNCISFNIKKGETVGIVGESGCGKSITSLSLLGLIDPPGKIENGEIWFDNKNILTLTDDELRTIRGNNISMIFQEPMTSLNPVFTIGDQIAEVFCTHQNLSKKEAKSQALKMLENVKIPAAKQRINEYPHQLSGGMRQRVMIAMALACKPDLLIADEPTTALDVTIQAQILALIENLKIENNMSVLMITHDLGVVAEFCDYILIMYAGNIVEKGTVKDLFTSPRHPYTQGLINSIPKLGVKVNKLPTISGSVPSLIDLPSGCYFNPRCPKRTNICRQQNVYLEKISDSHWVSCFNHNR